MSEMQNRPLWPRLDELFAQADEAIEAMRADYKKKDAALATAFLSAIEQPFHELTPFGQGCSCDFGPRCESSYSCEDEAANMGVKDRRTGTIRARARCSFFHPFSFGPVPRIVFYCNDCFVLLKEGWGKPIRGLHPPKGASDFYQPSLRDMIQIAGMEIRRQEKATKARR